MATTTTAPLELSPVVGGRSVPTGSTYEVRSPYDDALVAVIHRAGPAEIEAAIAGAVRAFQVTRKLPAWKRAEVLGRIADGIEAAKEDFARTIALEAGKPIKTARLEAERAAFTFRVAAEETKRIHGELLQLDWLPGTEGRTGQVRRVPLGPIAGISPFNFPLNLVAHKVAPALAAGNPIVRAAGEPDADQRAEARADRARGRLARGGDRGRAVDDGRRRAARRGRPLQAAHVHGQPGRRLGAEGPLRHEARDARARRQRRGRGRGGRRRRLRGRADRLGRHRLLGADVHLGAARLPPRVPRGLRGRPRHAASARWSPATRSTRRPTSGR